MHNEYRYICSAPLLDTVHAVGCSSRVSGLHLENPHCTARFSARVCVHTNMRRMYGPDNNLSFEDQAEAEVPFD